MKLSLKCHRAAMDFYKAFVMAELKKEDFDFEHGIHSMDVSTSRTYLGRSCPRPATTPTR